ncbi:acetyl-CoA C-acetyltransferase [Streptomyces coelicoflavus]|uniref:acetyl-CoA C-acetyltransferase n=1 Tax=Streptomyces coelicoflavus TaxID=285562 RepID=UPI0024AE856A|nr:acetyl-CoA C-acetyltransferase [Streptomyces coelicoflavus]MDI6520313.1 acetyl-CoA C-acetyltransferase [Streptomyces coelicoflavus]
MADAYIIESVRTAVGRRNGGLAELHPADLGGAVLAALVERADVDPAAVDDVVLGCLDPLGGQAANIARTSWLAAGLPESVPGVTIDRQCGSSQQAVHFAAQAVMSGTQDLVVAGGVQNMSAVPMASSWRTATVPDPFSGSAGWRARYGDTEITQFRGAELIADKWGLDRGTLEQFALESHRLAVAAVDAGRLAGQIVPVAGVTVDEGPRRDTTLEKMAALRPLSPGGRITAAVASQVSDGAAAMLVASEEAVRRHGLRPRARIRAMSVVGDDPVMMLTGPIPATRRVLERCGLGVDDIDLFEVNEAFAPVVLAWLAELRADPDRTNVNGGAIALGHPLGASGVRIMTDLLCELERQGARYGLQTMCEGGGLANATIIERL